MQPGTLNIAFTRGDDYALELTFTDNGDPPVALDYSAMDFAAQIRVFEDDEPFVVEFTVDATDSDTGVVILTLTAVETGLLEGVHAWDLEFVDGANATTTILAGTVTVKADVTRAIVP